MELQRFKVIIGATIGFLGGYAGIGGAPFLILILSVVMGFSQHEAQGTVLAMILGPITILGVINSWKLIRTRLVPIIICIITYAIVSFLGGTVAYTFVSADLQRIFGFGLILIGCVYATLFIERYIQKRHIFDMSVPNMIFVGSGVGFLGGMLGIGAGILLVPILTAFFGLEQNTARAISLAILLPPVSLGAVVKYGLIEADINWIVALILLVSYIILNGIGTSLGDKEHPDRLKKVLGVSLVLSGIFLIFAD